MVFDLTGMNVIVFAEVTSGTFYIGDLANGMYFVKLNFVDNSNLIAKVLISK